MKLCCTVCTYNRPHLLPRLITCFEEQDYQNRYMVIFDDGGQYGNLSGNRWRLVSTRNRYPSLGAKRNAVLEMVPDDTYAVLPTDDDDLFLPWHLSSAAEALERADWSRPSVVLTPAFPGGDLSLFKRNYTGHRQDQTQNRLYHPAWAMRLSKVWDAGGYPPDQSGPEDQGLMRKMEAMGVTQADPIDLGCQPSYIYCWDNGSHSHRSISGLLNSNDRNGAAAWRSLEHTCRPAALSRWTPPFDLHHPVMSPFISPRPF